MKNKFDKKIAADLGAIVTNWLILVITSAVILSSCQGMRSVRGGAVNSLNSKNKNIDYSQKEKDFETAPEIDQQISEFEKKILNKKNAVPKTEPEKKVEIKDVVITEELAQNEPVLPSISDQIKRLNDEQSKINNKMNQFDQDINQIKKVLTNIEDKLDILYDEKDVSPETGNIQSNKKSNNKEFSFNSDDEQTVETQTKSNKKLSKDELKKIASKETFTENVEFAANRVKKNQTKQNVIKKEVKSEASFKPAVISLNMQNGIMEFRKGNYNGAIDLLKQALAEETSVKNSAEIEYYLGESYFFINDFKSSINYFTRVLNSKNPSFSAKSQLRIAEANMRSGKISEAKLAYQKLISSYPESEFVPQARKMLQQL